jgi:hypothetical protein
MLLQIDIYPNGGSDSQSQTLFVNPATINNRHQRRKKDDRGKDKDKNDGDIGLIVTVGRKVGMDIVFKDEKSLSRRHAALRFVATKTDNNNDNDNDNGYFAEPRNEEETSACENSEYGICLVLENTGKVGSYVASRDETVQTKDEEQKTNNNNKNNGVDSDDETTDDEGNVSQQPTQMSQMYATSMSTQTGKKIDDAPPRISNAIRNYFGNNAVKLLKLQENENQILSFDDNTTDNNDEDNNGNTNASVPIMIQFGSTNDQFTQPTIKITRIPMNVVMSSTVPSTIRDSLRFCGGLIQNGGLPCDGETTHLVVTEQMPVAKQILAWCYGIPIVSPGYIQALNDHEDIHEPFPVCTTFPPTNDNNTFWDYEHNKKLLSNYIMLSADESSEFESEHLAIAAGGCVERLYDAGKKPTKAKVNTFTKYAQSLISDNENNDTTIVLLSSSSGSNSKSKSTNINLLIKKIKDLGIETLTPKAIAKAITKQESDLIALKNGTINSTTEKSKSDSTEDSTLAEVQKRTQSNHDDAQDRVPDNNNDSSCLVSEATPAISVVKDRNSNNDNMNKMKAATASQGDQVQQRELEGADSNGWFVVAPKDNRERMRQVASEAYKRKTGGDIERSASTNGVVRIIITPMATQPPPSSSLTGRHRRGPPSQRGGDVPNFKKFKKNSFRPVGPNDRVVLLQSMSSTRQNHHELSAEQREIEEDQRLADALFRGDPVPVQRKRHR